MNKMTTRTLLMAMAMMITSVSYAQDAGYIGVQYGQFRTSDASQNNGDHEDMDHIGVSIGANLLPTISLEAQYTTNVNDKQLGAGSTLSSQVIGAYAKIQTPTPVYVNGRIGVARVDYELDTPLFNDTESTDGLSYGVGVGIKLADTASIEANYTRLPDLEDQSFNNTDIKNELLTVGVNFHF